MPSTTPFRFTASFTMHQVASAKDAEDEGLHVRLLKLISATVLPAFVFIILIALCAYCILRRRRHGDETACMSCPQWPTITMPQITMPNVNNVVGWLSGTTPQATMNNRPLTTNLRQPTMQNQWPTTTCRQQPTMPNRWPNTTRQQPMIPNRRPIANRNQRRIPIRPPFRYRPPRQDQDRSENRPEDETGCVNGYDDFIDHQGNHMEQIPYYLQPLESYAELGGGNIFDPSWPQPIFSPLEYAATAFEPWSTSALDCTASAFEPWSTSALDCATSAFEPWSTSALDCATSAFEPMATSFDFSGISESFDF